MQYKSYQHIEKLGTSATDGILNGEVNLFYKIDGTNACVFLKDDDSLGFGSRNREVSLGNDNAKFMSTICNDEVLMNKLKAYLKSNPDCIIYGEWLVPVTIKRYGKDAWKKFYIFDIYNTLTDKYVSYDDYKDDLDQLNLTYIPRIKKLINPTEEDIKQLLDETGSFLITEGLGEGIVIKNYEFINRFGRTTWAKVLTEDFLLSKKDHRRENCVNKTENTVEKDIIEFLTLEFVQKEKSKLEELKGDWQSKYIFELLNRVFTEFWKDNWEIILKKFKNPTINFRVLRQLSDNVVKSTLNI